MNKDFIANKWIPALRSGKYTQGVGGLRYEDSFCCLGVACDLLIKEGLLSGDWYSVDGAHFCLISGSDPLVEMYPGKVEFRNSGFLPTRVAEYIGISTKGPAISCSQDDGHTSYYENLANANDLEATFEQIADGLERLISSDDQQN